MGPEELRFLLSAEGQAVLAELAATPVSEGTHMAVAARLRAQLGPERGRAALDTALLRQRAARKFSRAAAMMFTRDGLEQATAEPIAAHRAARFAAAGVTTVADLGCGIGGDALALAGAGAAVLAIDRDRLRLLMAAANAAGGPTIVLSAGPRQRAAEGWGRFWRNRLRNMGLAERPTIITLTPATNQTALAARLAGAGAIFFTGNDAVLMADLVAAMRAAGTDTALRDWWLGGGVFLADRAAAAAVGTAMSAEPTPTGGNVEYQSSDSFLADYIHIRPGLGLLPAVVEPRPLYDYLYGRMVSHVMAAPGTVVVGVERGAALRVTPAEAAMIGDEAALVLDSRYAATLAVGDNDAFAATWLLLDTFPPGTTLAAR